MEYTINKLAKVAGVTTRTLRFYDEIGLLAPARISSNGYRIYGKKEIDRLQYILFYRELGVSLEEIKNILNQRILTVSQRSKAICPPCLPGESSWIC